MERRDQPLAQAGQLEHLHLVLADADVHVELGGGQLPKRQVEATLQLRGAVEV